MTVSHSNARPLKTMSRIDIKTTSDISMDFRSRNHTKPDFVIQRISGDHVMSGKRFTIEEIVNQLR